MGAKLTRKYAHGELAAIEIEEKFVQVFFADVVDVAGYHRLCTKT